MTKYVVGLIVLITAFGFGRLSAPQKVKIETKIVEVEKKTDKLTTDTDRDKHKETVTTIVTHKDGTTETTTKVVEDSKTDRKTTDISTDDKSKVATSKKEITRGALVTVSVLAGVNVTSPSIDFGMAVTKPILGPITVGIFGFKSGIIGASLGLTF